MKKTKDKKSDKKPTIAIFCKYDELAEVDGLKPHPKNRNKHGQDQVEALAKLYAAHGIRHPIIVSKRSGCIVAGHGRRLALIRAGIKKAPVVYQDFESEEKEYAFIQSDNAIALWAELDTAGIRKDIEDFDFDFDPAWLGIKNFVIEKTDTGFDPDSEEGEKKHKHKQCPHCGEVL